MEIPYRFTAQQIVLEGRTTKENIEIIRNWLSDLDDKYVPSKIQDEVIVLFLLSCKNDLDLTKHTVITYYQCKKNGPEIHDDRSVERQDIQLALNTFHLSDIPVRTDDNYAVHYFKLNNSNSSNFELVPTMKMSYMLVDVTQMENPPNGLVTIFDMKGIGLMHLTKLRLGPIKKYLHFLQEGMPMHIKEIHVLNTVYFMDKIMAIFKTFMKSELLNILHLHPPGLEQNQLFEIVPKKCLPKEYGGDLPSESELHERTLKQFKDLQTFWYIEERVRKQCK